MNILIVGATGVVGQEMIRCLEQRHFPVAKLRLSASSKSAGKKVKTAFGEIVLENTDESIFQGVDIALFAAGSEVSGKLAPIAAKQGCLVIDNASFFRYREDVPLVIPEINPEAAFKHKGIIANPNCTTAIASIPLWVIEKNFGLKKVIMSTYQAASGAGKAAMDELESQAKEYSQDKPLTIKEFAYQILFNLIPQIDVFQDNAYTKEEMKVVWETRKIFSRPDLAISCTAVRVPVIRAHSESIVVETEKPINPSQASKLMEETQGIKVVDDPSKRLYPMPLDASGKYDVLVGRIRQSLVFGDHGLEFFVSGDQLLKGAALNAVQIAELFIKK